jgi:hypothetical protein
MYDSLAAMHAALQGLGEPQPFGIVLKQIGALSNGLKNIIQIVNQTFQG